MRWITTEEREKRKQYAVGCGVLLGALVSVSSIIVGYALTSSSVHRATYTREPTSGKVNDIGVGVYIPVAVVLFFGGILICIGSLLYGYFQDKNKNQGARIVRPSSRIIARFAIDKNGIQITDESSFEFQDKLRYYVRVLSPTEGSLEYECAEPVFYQCGEGMIGDIELMGRWIGAFRPYTGMEQTHVGERF
jgi:hypothetical protein